MKKIVRQAGSAGAVGMEIVLAIGVGFFGGSALDEKLGTGPWLTAILTAAGVGAAIKALVRVARQYQKLLAEDESAAQPRTTDGKRPPDDR